MIKRIDVYTPLSDVEISRLWEEIEAKYDNNLSRFSVKLPTPESGKYYQLIYLYKYMNCCVNKDIISTFVQEHVPTAKKDQQVRHLAADGFCVLTRGEQITNTQHTVPSGYYVLETLNYPKPSFMSAYLKRQALLSTTDFEDLKKLFNYRCATCGAKEGEPHRVTGTTVTLQQGHMNPNLTLGAGNTIPQCQYCNQNIFKDYFIFDENGFPNKINNPEYVLRSEKRVRKEMYDLIKKKDKLN